MRSAEKWKKRDGDQPLCNVPRWKAIRLQVLRRDKYLCQTCLPGRYTEATEVDHVIPRAQGGTHELSNLSAICEECHHKKSMREAGCVPRGTTAIDGAPEGW